MSDGPSNRQPDELTDGWQALAFARVSMPSVSRLELRVSRILDTMKKVIKRLSVGLVILLLLAITGFVAWTRLARYPATPAAQLVASHATRTAQQWLIFTPDGASSANPGPMSGLIIYPGALVDYVAYAPLADAIAQRGYFVVLVPMPLDLAILNTNAATPVIAAYPNIKTWIIAGHSLGGTAAGQFVATNPGAAAGLVFWASFPASPVGFGATRILSIYGTDDGVLRRKGQALIDVSPPGAIITTIPGGNHGMFGSYGNQQGDNPLAISEDAARVAITDATAQFMSGLR